MMAIKQCCIENCNSSSVRVEDKGVTFHKFPKEKKLYKSWLMATKHQCKELDKNPIFVCSRHFRKVDFENYKDTKYVLKSDAVPSIFYWTMDVNETKSPDEKIVSSMDKSNKHAQEVSSLTNLNIQDTIHRGNDIIVMDKTVRNNDEGNLKSPQKPIETSAIDIMLNEKSNDVKKITASFKKGNGSIDMQEGKDVEVKDYEGIWYPAIIQEVDLDEMEVLVKYAKNLKKQDEWIKVSSPRMRPFTGLRFPIFTKSPPPEEIPPKPTLSLPLYHKFMMPPEPKHKQKFEVGERCLARWKNCSRFYATICKVLGNDEYEILFDDGAPWTCSASRLFKIKGENATITSAQSAPNSEIVTTSETSEGASGSSELLHKHLFDPTCDYLGSKSERRELKRKLNIKALFNIGQKKKKGHDRSERPRKMESDAPTSEMNVDDAKYENTEKPLICNDPVPRVVMHDIHKDIKNIKKNNKVSLSNYPSSSSVNEDMYEPGRSADEDSEVRNFSHLADLQHEETICKMKEVISKLESGISSMNKEHGASRINTLKKVDEQSRSRASSCDRKCTPNDATKAESTKKVNIKHGESTENTKEENKLERSLAETDTTPTSDTLDQSEELDDIAKIDKQILASVLKEKKFIKMNKTRRIRLLRNKKAQLEIQRVKSQLKEMRKQMEEMREQVKISQMNAANAMSPGAQVGEAPNFQQDSSFLLPGEWCCKWVNGQPVGERYESELDLKSKKPRYAVKVEDKRLPPKWTKLMVRRHMGNTAGKWDVVLISPEKRRFHTKHEVKVYLESLMDESLLPHRSALLDFGIHRKLSRRLGWDTTSSHVETTMTSKKKKKRKRSVPSAERDRKTSTVTGLNDKPSCSTGVVAVDAAAQPVDNVTGSSVVTEEGYVTVGALKVQILQNLLRCPSEGCFKNFRNDTLLRMHIKHYHKELISKMGMPPKVLDLAYARTAPAEPDVKEHKSEPRARAKTHRAKRVHLDNELQAQLQECVDFDKRPVTPPSDTTPKMVDSPKLRNALINKPVKRPRVLLPVRRLTQDEHDQDEYESQFKEEFERKYGGTQQVSDYTTELDFEAAISVHTVPKIENDKKRKSLLPPVLQKAKQSSEDDDWCSSDFESRSSFPGSATPDSKTLDYRMDDLMHQIGYSGAQERRKEGELYITTETGERIKVERMKREEIINCHCGFREEDGLMVQCELCLCWQHALCHNIEKVTDVPEKYTCSICLNPRRGRRSQRFLHDQDRLYEGLLPGARPSEPLRRSHELSGNLLRIDDALHALRVKYYVATKKNHPKLYLWAKDWENADLTDKLNSEFDHLTNMISDIGKENLPLKSVDFKDLSLSDIRIHSSEDLDDQRLSQRSDGSNSLTQLLSSPGGGSLDLSISTMELERLAKSVQESEAACRAGPMIVPQPEAAIENSVCRDRLLKHIQQCQALVESRLDSIEAQVVELESQDPSFEDDETADFFPRTKQTVQMLLRDLDTMEELGVIT